jgi:tRNA G18 (ribose-2'-O)-methylase SpoU
MQPSTPTTQPTTPTLRLKAGELRDIDPQRAAELMRDVPRNPIYLILEDVLDTYNIGGLFRLADSLLASKIYLCGGSETPPNHRIKKASIGTYKIVPWSYKATAVEAVVELKAEGVQVLAVEQDAKSVDYSTFDYSFPIALLVGHETTGVKPETLKECDGILEIPMWGINTSLNVIVSTAIVAYHACINHFERS